MMIEITSYKTQERPDLAELSKQIRQSVFVGEQNVDPALEYDEYEDLSTHYLLFKDKSAVATARWRETKKGLKPQRNKGLGAILLDRVLKDVIPLGKHIYLNSQLKAIPFYRRRGFKKVGALFIEADIEHYEMYLDVVE